MTEMDEYYRILGLTPEASEEEIKQAYRDLVKVWHPDRFPNNQRLRDKANSKIKEINIAYDKLKSHVAQNSRESVSELQPSADGTPGESSPAESGSYRKSGSVSKVNIAWGMVIAGLLLLIILLGLTKSRHVRSTSSGPSSSLYESLTSNHSTSPFDPDPAAESKEFQKIGFLFECIRQANLQKDIDLFMSCFSRNFNGVEVKRKDTLKMWDTFNYYNLTYEFKRQTINGDIADVRLEWIIAASEKLGGKPHNATMVLDVTLMREDGCWRILDIKPVS